MSDNTKNPDDMSSFDEDNPLNNKKNRENSENTSDNINNEISNSDEVSKPDISKIDLKNEIKEDAEHIEKTEESSIEPKKVEQDKTDSEENEIKKPLKPLLNKNANAKSNYQISLVNQNLLKVNVTTKQGVKLNSSISAGKNSIESQSNEIYLYPKFDESLQEIEVIISIEDEDVVNEVLNTDNIESEAEEVKEEIKSEDSIDENEKIISAEKEVGSSESKSNYQINLINENLLKVKIESKNNVKIESVSRDKKTSIESQANKIVLNSLQGNELQTIEITIEIDTVKKAISVKDSEGNFKLTPNPEVVDLIQPPTYPVFDEHGEILDPVTGFKNPFDAIRKLIQRNTTIGIIAAVIIHLAAAGIVYYNFSKKSKDAPAEEQQRLIVIRDLPDPKIKIEDVEDPNKPKIEEIIPDENLLKTEEQKREVKPRKIVKPPIVSRPNREDNKKDTLPDSELVGILDSLRKLTDSSLAANTNINDTASSDSVSTNYTIPDSLRNNFSEKDIGLGVYFPNNWKLTDQREINKNEKDFKGVLLTDTTAAQPGTMTLFIFLDNEGKDYNAEDFKTEFAMNDSNLTAFSKQPSTLAGYTEYRVYIYNKIGLEKLSVRASVRKQFFDQYKNEIEAVVRSIRIQKPENIKKDSL